MKIFSASVMTLVVLAQACVPGGLSGMPSDGGDDEMTELSGDGGVGSTRPTLVTVAAQVAGRAGRDLQVSFQGKDRGLDIVALSVRTLDAQGTAVTGLDLNSDGVLESREGTVAIESPQFVGETLTSAVVLRGAAGAGQVTVALVDKLGARSVEQTVTVSPQPIKMMGMSCDPKFASDRCSAGLGCRGTPPTCAEGLPPQIGKLGFYKAAGGPMILIDGTEPEDDLAEIRFEFQNSAGKPISIDSDGDDMPDMSEFAMSATGLSIDGAFFLRMQAGEGLDQQVGKLVATPIDSAGHAGPAKIAAPTAVPVKSASQACDPRGFDVCSTGLVCAPGVVGKANKCEAAKPLRTSQCASAPVLTASASGASVVGRADGASLWNTPTGCSSNDPQGRPEGVVLVRLAARADKLILSTSNPGTTFDTALYVMQGCPDDSSKALQCSDDAPGAHGLSEITLVDMPAGDYLVVIDSFDYVGGAFELSARVE